MRSTVLEQILSAKTGNKNEYSFGIPPHTSSLINWSRIDAPELHRVALDQLIRELVCGGMPAEIAVDIINNSVIGEIRIPLTAQNYLNTLLNTMPLPLTVYCSDTVDRELQKLPMYGTKAPEVKAEERDKYIAAHPPSLEALRLCTIHRKFS